MTKKYHVIHKLTNKPVVDLKTFAPLEFEKQKALEVCAMKNRIMGADFYKIQEIKK